MGEFSLILKEKIFILKILTFLFWHCHYFIDADACNLQILRDHYAELHLSLKHKLICEIWETRRNTHTHTQFFTFTPIFAMSIPIYVVKKMKRSWRSVVSICCHLSSTWRVQHFFVAQFCWWWILSISLIWYCFFLPSFWKYNFNGYRILS